MTETNTTSILVLSIRDRFPEAVAIYLFGSHANGTSTAESDYDLAILLPQGKKIDPVSLFNFTLDLSASINQDIDLIDLNACSTVLAFQIVMKGKTIYLSDKTYVELFENTVMSMYQRLNEERKEIIIDFVTV